MSEEPGPAVRVDKFGSTFEWTAEGGWRVTPPSGLLLPPWDLCGFDRRFDPYGIDDDEIRWCYREVLGLTVSGQLKVLERHIERDVDPNRRDGEWPELAFMPHFADPVPDGVERIEFGKRIAFRAKWLTVPAYLNVREALVREQMLRKERRQIADG